MRAPDQIEKDHPETDLMTQAIIRGAEGYRVAVPLMEAWDGLPRSVQVAICMEFSDLRAVLASRPAEATSLAGKSLSDLRKMLEWEDRPSPRRDAIVAAIKEAEATSRERVEALEKIKAITEASHPATVSMDVRDIQRIVYAALTPKASDEGAEG